MNDPRGRKSKFRELVVKGGERLKGSCLGVAKEKTGGRFGRTEW